MSENPENRCPDHDDPELWRDVFAGCETGLRAFLRARLRQEMDVEDCLQITFIKAIESGRDIPQAARRAWLFRVASNEAALFWRRKATTDRVLENQSSTVSGTVNDDAIDRVIQQEQLQKIRELTSQLPQQWQDIIRLRIEQNLTFQQIANQLDIPLGTALTQMRRAIERIKSEIE